MELSVELITRAQAAELLTVSEDTIDRLVKSGQLPAYRITPKIASTARTWRSISRRATSRPRSCSARPASAGRTSFAAG